MSDSSDDGEPFQLRDYSEDSDEGRPNKRRKTMRQPALRAKGLGFVSATAQDNDSGTEDEIENDPDNERPTLGTGLGLGGFRSSFNIGEYNDDARTRSPSPDSQSGQETPKSSGRGPSAFSSNGKIQKSSFAARMMAKMGHVEGQGLGKTGQGISAPIQAQLLQSRAGLGHGTAPEKPVKTKQGRSSQSSTPGTSTSKIKAPPKKKYEVSAIESRGLHIPEAIKSIIIDATGTDTKTVTTLSGFSTPTGEEPPRSEAAKSSARIKMQLQAYADAWDATKEHESSLQQEEQSLQTAVQLYLTEEQRVSDVITTFEKISMDDSGQSRDWDQVIAKLRGAQERFADHIEELDLPELASACLEGPFRKSIVEWEPLTEPTKFIDSFKSIGALLELEKSSQSRQRRRAIAFESLLSAHWFPHIRSSLKDWSVYDPVPAVNLVQEWQSILPPWLQYKTLHEVILPKLLEAIRRFPKMVESNTRYGTNNRTSPSKSRKAPDMYSWLFDWWPLLDDPNLCLERFPELKTLVKSKVDSSSWPTWKPVLGSKRSKSAPQKDLAISSLPSTPSATVIEDVSFKDIVQDWCGENNLLLRSTGRSDMLGRLLYRLQDAERKSKGILVYLQEDVVFSEAGDPYGLDDSLVKKVMGT